MEDIIKIEDLDEIKKKLCLNVPKDIVDEKFDIFFNDIKKEAQINGFRKGRAPVKVLKHYFKNKSLGAVSQILISEYYQTAIKEHNLNPVQTPKLVPEEGKDYIGEFNEDGTYFAELMVEVMPTVDPVGYNDIEVEQKEHDFDEIYQEKMLEYRDKFAEREQITDGETQLGDDLVLDFKGFIDNEPFDGGAAEGFAIQNLGQNTLIPSFEEQLVGLKAGDDEYTINVVFPEDYTATHLAGKEASFVVKIHNIVRKHLAEVDDDLALMSGFLSVEELEDSVKEDAEKTLGAFKLRDAESQILAKLFEDNPIQIPETLIVKEAKSVLSQYNIQNPTPEMMDKIYMASENNVKKSIILNAIYDKEEDIDLSIEELSEELEKQAQANGVSKDEMVSGLYNKGLMEDFVGNLRGRKVIEHIAGIGKEQSDE